MRQVFAMVVGKFALFLTRLRGGGSAFPGLVALKIAPRWLGRAFDNVPEGIVFVLGSNGKSTTTHMVSEILRAHGLTVFTNPTGANLPQGVASSLLPQVGLSGRVKADVAVLEVDEAFCEELAAILHPRVVLGLNTQVDQLYRFIETERAANMMLGAMVQATQAVISNRDDPYLATVDEWLDARPEPRPALYYFGASPEVVAASPSGLLNATNFGASGAGKPRTNYIEVTSSAGRATTLVIDGNSVELSLPAAGLHYSVDAAAATATARQVLESAWSVTSTQAAFAAMKPAYGRGEVLPFEDTTVQFVMFKNLASLQLNLDALPANPGPVMLAIDEGTPDMSWIYDVHLERLPRVEVITGDKAWQMATCLTMKGVEIGLVEPNVSKAVEHMRTLVSPGVEQVWIVNYEVTMIARKLIGFGELETRA